MKKYKVTIQRLYDIGFEIEGENEFDAEEKANEKFDELLIYGSEMYENQVEVKEQLDE